MNVQIGILFATLLSVSPSAAEGTWVCDNSQDTASHNKCADREFKKYDAEMNVVYASLLKRTAQQNETVRGYGAPPLLALKSSQRAWLKFRDQNCHWQSTAMYGGSGQSVILSSCRALMTRDRVRELKEFGAME